MKVVLRDGVTLHYPTARYCVNGSEEWSLYTRQGGQWLATFPRDFVAYVETREAMGAVAPVDPGAALVYVADNIHGYTDIRHRPALNAIKAALQRDYSSRTGWKDELVEEEEEN